jgi:hypothetical protein
MRLPARMQAVGITKPGGPEVLSLRDEPLPGPRTGELLVRVAAAGVNRPNIQQRRGPYPPPPGASEIPGLGPVVRGSLISFEELTMLHPITICESHMLPRFANS